MFASRAAAGRSLAVALHVDPDRALHVFAVSREGIAIAVHVAAPFGANVDIICARYSAVSIAVEGCRSYVELDRVIELGLHAADVSAELAELEAQIARAMSVFRGQRPLPSIYDHHVVLVDDGSTPARVLAAVARRLRALGAARVTVAVPVCSPASVQALSNASDDVVCLVEGVRRSAYDEAEPVGELEALALLDRSRLAASRVRFSARTITI